MYISTVFECIDEDMYPFSENAERNSLQFENGKINGAIVEKS